MARGVQAERRKINGRKTRDVYSDSSSNKVSEH